MILFKAGVIFASSISKSGNSGPSIYCDVTRSSIDLATSTSLIHNIVIVGQPEQERTSVLKLVFQHWKSEPSGNLSKCRSRSDSSDFPSCNFEDKFLLYEKRDSRSKTSWQSEELVLHDSAVLFSILLLVPQFCMYQVASVCKKNDATFFGCSKSAEDGSLRPGRPSKGVLMYPMGSVYQAASQSRGQSWDSECSWVDWNVG